MLDPVDEAVSPDEVLSGAVDPINEGWAAGTVSNNTMLKFPTLKEPLVLRYCFGTVRALEFSPTSEHLFTGDATGSLFLTDVKTQLNTWSLRKAHRDRIECARFMTDSTIVVGDKSVGHSN